MAKIRLSDSNMAGDIPSYEIKKEDILGEFQCAVHEFLDLSNGRVIVCFQSWTNAEEHNDEHKEFFITNNDIDAISYFENYIKDVLCEDIDFNFFCFEKYREAFEYCISLKEGY